jgi:hypothetical protein
MQILVTLIIFLPVGVLLWPPHHSAGRHVVARLSQWVSLFLSMGSFVSFNGLLLFLAMDSYCFFQLVTLLHAIGSYFSFPWFTIVCFNELLFLLAMISYFFFL